MNCAAIHLRFSSVRGAYQATCRGIAGSGRTPRREELEEAVEVAKAKAPESAPAPAPVPTAEDQKAAIDAAVAAALTAKDAALRTRYQTDIEKPVESGRLEGTIKLRLKDTQLIRAQSKLKELELQIEEWKKAGVVPGESAAPSASVPPAASLTTTAPSSVPSPTTSAPARGGAPAPPTSKPSVPGAPASPPARDCGRGALRGGGSIGIRGAAAPSAGRGAGVPASGITSGFAIMGAAAKRAREEGEVATEDSLAKCLKPVVAAAAAITALLTVMRMLVVRPAGSPSHCSAIIVFSHRDISDSRTHPHCSL